MTKFVLAFFTIALAFTGKVARLFQRLADRCREKWELHLREHRRALEIRRRLIRERRAAMLTILSRSEARRARRAGRQVAILMRHGRREAARDWAQTGIKHLSAARSYHAQLKSLAA